jgi:hypothetical protein
MTEVWELIKRMQSKDISTDTLKLALWIAGSGIEQFDGKEDSPVFGDASLEQVALDLAEIIDSQDPGLVSEGVYAAKEMNPMVKAMLKKLLKMLLEAW